MKSFKNQAPLQLKTTLLHSTQTIFLITDNIIFYLLWINLTLITISGKLIAVMGDEDTCTGFLLGGIGEINKQRKANYMVVDKDTPTSDIEDQLKFV